MMAGASQDTQTRRERDMIILKRSRFRRILKWASVAATTLVLVLWVAAASITTKWVHLHHRDGSCSAFTFAFHRDAFAVGSIAHAPSHAAKSWPGCCNFDWGANSDNWRRRLPVSNRLGRSPLRLVSQVSGPHWNHRFVFFRPWLLAAVVGFPTALLISFDRRRRIPPGHCQTCGYNLTGNLSGICPECGEPCDTDGGEA